MTITNNFFSTNVGWGAAILCRACNGGGPQAGTITIAGNTMQGPFDQSRAGIVIEAPRQEAFLQQDFVIKNNIVANASPGLNVAANYAPENFIANGNLYDPAAEFRWKEPKHWISMSLEAWQDATGQGHKSRVGTAEFVDATAGDLHWQNRKNSGLSTGVDITSITPVDIDTQSRSATHPVAGADVPTPTSQSAKPK